MKSKTFITLALLSLLISPSLVRAQDEPSKAPGAFDGSSCADTSAGVLRRESSVKVKIVLLFMA